MKQDSNDLSASLEKLLRVGPLGVSISVWASPRSRRVGVMGFHGDALKVGVKAPPEDGKATEELRSVLAAILGIKLHQVVLLSGAISRQKVFRVTGLSKEELLTGLRVALKLT